MRPENRLWTAEDHELAVSMRAEGHTWDQIAQAMGRTTEAVKSRINRSLLCKRLQYRNVHAPINEQVLADRDRRYSIRPRDLTAAFFGDPLPGYSALERRHG